MKDKVIAIVGPTAVGKTSLGIELAKRLNGEVISGDSMQIYRGMDIGTAKVTEKEMENIPHHMIDIKDPDQSFSVAEFQKHVRKHITDINQRGRVPIIVGGTGLYIKAALYDYQFTDEARDDTYQKKIEEEIAQFGIDLVYSRLQSVDPDQAKTIHPNNTRRVIRALEIYDRTGETNVQRQGNQSQDPLYDATIIGLDMDRSLLYERINHRVDMMMKSGLLEEVCSFYNQGLEDYQSMKAIGYKEFIPYLKGESDLEQSRELLKRNSRRFAKRQYTWFKNKMNVKWYKLTHEDTDQVFNKIFSDLAGISNDITNRDD